MDPTLLLQSIQHLKAMDTQVHSNNFFKAVVASGPAFKDCVITNSVLANCTVVKTIITGTTLERCILVDCDVLNSHLNGSHVKNSKVDNCMLVNCDVQEGQLKNSCVNSSKVIDNEIISCLRSKCEVSPTPPLNRMPSEVRLMIFSKVITWNGKTPALLAAVRGDPVFYREALQVLRRNCTFRIHKANEISRKTMGVLAFHSIQRLYIHIGDYIMFRRTHPPEPSPFSGNLEEICVDLSFSLDVHNTFCSIAEQWTRHLQSIRKMSLVIKELRFQEEQEHKETVEVGNRCLGVKGKRKPEQTNSKLVRTRPGRTILDALTIEIEWVWEAKDGKVLIWNAEDAAIQSK